MLSISGGGMCVWGGVGCVCGGVGVCVGVCGCVCVGCGVVDGPLRFDKYQMTINLIFSSSLQLSHSLYLSKSAMLL